MSNKEQQELEEFLNTYLEEMTVNLNLRLLMEQNHADCINIPILWVEHITLTGVAYPEMPQRKSLHRRVAEKLSEKLTALWKRIKFW